MKPGTLEFDLDAAGLGAICGPEQNITASRTLACASGIEQKAGDLETSWIDFIHSSEGCC